MQMAKFERFDVDLDGGKSNSSRWVIWLRRFDLYIEANAITGDRKKIATLLTEAGSGVEEIYEAMRDGTKAKADEKYAEISKLISDHFAPQKNLNMSRLKFRETSHHIGESIDEYFVRLKTAARECEFADTDNEILLQLIQGCNDKRVKLKASQETISLANLLKFIQSLEYSTEISSAPGYRKEQGACKMESVYKIDGNESKYVDKKKDLHQRSVLNVAMIIRMLMSVVQKERFAESVGSVITLQNVVKTEIKSQNQSVHHALNVVSKLSERIIWS
jgi:hypothetical protein